MPSVGEVKKPDKDFEAFASSYGTSLLRAAVLLTGDHGHAEDLVQSTLFRTSRRWSVACRAPKAYSRKVLVNLSRDRIRRLVRRPKEELNPFSGSDSRFDPVHPDETQALVDQHVLSGALRRLPSQQREVVVMRFLLDLSVAETAHVLGIAEGTVKSSTSRATRQLHELLSDDPISKREVHSENRR
jgi:RNA polymerase sigma-70 factor (sigma-E family)